MVKLNNKLNLRLVLFLFGIVSSFTSFNCQATESAEQAAWNRLSAIEKAELEARWQAFKAKAPADRAELQNGILRYLNLNHSERRRVDLAYVRWRGLSPEERSKVKAAYQQWKNFSPEKKQRIRDVQSLKANMAK